MSAYRRYNPGPYDEMAASFEWEVPDRYNIASDTVDKHEPGRLAMLWEDWQGNERRITFGDMQEMSNRIANVLSGLGVRRGDRVAVLLPSLPETAATFIAVYKVGGILLSLSQLYGDDSIVHRLSDSGARVLVTDGANRPRLDDMRGRVELLEHVLVLNADEELGSDDVDLDRAMREASSSFQLVEMSPDDPAQLYYSSGTTGQAKGILHAHRYLLGHNEYELCHDVRDDELFHSTGEW
ncbi:MAG: acyl-CoA synthetase, partial [Actinobacteria bacterium]|nr:acyl-CoA synthetase [Actinomycetota bacterium]